jgi:hypothetical protein
MVEMNNTIVIYSDFRGRFYLKYIWGSRFGTNKTTDPLFRDCLGFRVMYQVLYRYLVLSDLVCAAYDSREGRAPGPKNLIVENR